MRDKNISTFPHVSRKGEGDKWRIAMSSLAPRLCLSFGVARNLNLNFRDSDCIFFFPPYIFFLSLLFFEEINITDPTWTTWKLIIYPLTRTIVKILNNWCEGKRCVIPRKCMINFSVEEHEKVIYSFFFFFFLNTPVSLFLTREYYIEIVLIQKIV